MKEFGCPSLDWETDPKRGEFQRWTAFMRMNKGRIMWGIKAWGHLENLSGQ